MKPLFCTVALVAMLGVASASQASGNAQAGKARATGCVGCHGANGQGVGANPPLAGKSEDQIEQALKDYKSGKRANAIMKGIASPLKDQDVQDLAAYFASLKK